MDSFCKDIMDSPLLQDQATDLDMMVDQYDRVLQQLLDQYAPKKKTSGKAICTMVYIGCRC